MERQESDNVGEDYILPSSFSLVRKDDLWRTPYNSV